LLVLTSNRGLCGGYNTSVLRVGDDQYERLGQEGQDVDLRVSGKKGIQHCKFNKRPVAAGYTNFDEKTTYGDVEKLADELIDLYCTGAIGGVRVVYTRFVSTVKHYPDTVNLLPLRGPEQPAARRVPGKRQRALAEYIFSPASETILKELIPMTVRTQLYQCFMEAIVSEQAARMTAMQAASANAEQMLNALMRQYNRLRQSEITSQLLDIIAGTEALA